MDTHSINCVFAVLSTVVFLIGASLSTTRQFQVQRLYSDNTGANIALGFAYIIPGLAGLFTALLQRRIWYICQSVLGSVCLVIMHVVYLMGLQKPAPEAAFSPERCFIKDGICVCSISSLRSLVNSGYSCDDLNYMRSLGIVSDVLFVLGAVMLLKIIIISGVLSRRTQQLDPNQLIIPTHDVYFKTDNDALSPTP